jgi:O-antigen/teichoic acid export membrane protein
MLFDAARRGQATTVRRTRIATLWRLQGRALRRLSWGVADQAVSSLTNFAVSIFVVHTLGAVQLGTFSLAYVTYGLVLNASRGLATDPLMVRFSGTDLPTWRGAVANCTGTAATVGLVAGTCVLAAASFLNGSTRGAFLALGLTLPGLMLQDSWRFSFFALGRGSQAFLNDMIWAIALLPALALLRITHHGDVFWFVFAWGISAAVGAAAGPWQARVTPRLSGAWGWISQHRDLGWRYLAEGTSSSGSAQLRSYGIGLILGLATVGYVQAVNTLIGPITILFFAMSLVMIPEAARVLRRSPQRLPLLCVLISGGLAAAGLVWGVVLLIALPRGFGQWLLGPIWRPAYPLVLPQVIYITGLGASSGAGAGLHALGAARRSLRGMLLGSAAYLVLPLAGAVWGGAVGTMYGLAAAAWLAALIGWWQLRAALRESGQIPAGSRLSPNRHVGRHHSSPVRRSDRQERTGPPEPSPARPLGSGHADEVERT